MSLDIVNEIIYGSGYYILENAIDLDTVRYGLKFVRRITNNFPDNVLERRAWNLQKPFAMIANHSIVKDVVNVILGTKHKLGSFGANRLMPGASAQEAHTDYPYWGLFDKTTLPLNINSSFTLSCQTLIPLQDFTIENGATSVVPGSQRRCEYPNELEFKENSKQLELKMGDILIYHSLLWHRGEENRSNSDRICLLGQYVAYFIKDMM